MLSEIAAGLRLQRQIPLCAVDVAETALDAVLVILAPRASGRLIGRDDDNGGQQ